MYCEPKPIVVDHVDGTLSFIHEKEAGEFLAWCGMANVREIQLTPVVTE